MKKYKLLKHISLGPGIVLLDEGDGIGKVYFCESGIKRIMLNHPMIEDYGLSLKEFFKSGLFEALFDEFTKRKAKSYISNNAIFISEYTNKHVKGIISGSDLYSFTIELEDSYLKLSCSCPVSGLCKHLYAVMKYLSISKDDDIAFIGDEDDGEKTIINNYDKASKNKEISKKVYAFKSNIESFLYSKNEFSYIDFFVIHSKLVNEESFNEFMGTALIYFRRDQYKSRVSRELFPPLLFDSETLKLFTTYYENNSKNIDISNLFVTAYGQLNNVILPNLNKNSNLNRQYKLIKASFEKDLIPFLKLKNSYTSYYNATDYIFSLAYLLTRKNLDKDEIKELMDNQFFRRYASSVYNYYLSFSNNKIEGNNILLFLSYIRNLDEVDIPLDYVLSSLDYSEYNNVFLTTIANKFDLIDESYYPLIGDYLLSCSNDISIRRTTKDLIYEVLFKLPHISYLSEAIAYNFEQNGRWSSRY